MKNKKIIIVFGIAVAVVAVFLSRDKKGGDFLVIDPADAGLNYETGAMHEEWGKTTLDIEKGGKSTFRKYENLELKEEISFDASEDELAQILNVASQGGFFSLRDVYKDPSIMDGGFTAITIFYGDESKTVKVINDYNESFDAVESEIYKLIGKKTKKDNYDLEN